MDTKGTPLNFAHAIERNTSVPHPLNDKYIAQDIIDYLLQRVTIIGLESGNDAVVDAMRKLMDGLKAEYKGRYGKK